MMSPEVQMRNQSQTGLSPEDQWLDERGMSNGPKTRE